MDSSKFVYRVEHKGIDIGTVVETEKNDFLIDTFGDSIKDIEAGDLVFHVIDYGEQNE